VLNRAYGKPLEGRYPVAVVPMPGQCMVEIDQVDLPPRPAGRLAGVHSLALRLPAVDAATCRLPAGSVPARRAVTAGSARPANTSSCCAEPLVAAVAALM
jgi:hypothetical protein